MSEIGSDKYTWDISNAKQLDIDGDGELDNAWIDKNANKLFIGDLPEGKTIHLGSVLAEQNDLGDIAEYDLIKLNGSPSTTSKNVNIEVAKLVDEQFSNLPYDSDARGEKIMIKDVNGGKVLTTCDKNGKVKLDANNNPMQSRVFSGEEANMLEQYFNQGGIGDNTITRSEWIYGIGAMSIANNPQPPVEYTTEQEVVSLVDQQFAGLAFNSSDTVRIMETSGGKYCLATCDKNGKVKVDANHNPMQSRFLSGEEATILEKYFNQGKFDANGDYIAPTAAERSKGIGDNIISKAEWSAGTAAIRNIGKDPSILVPGEVAALVDEQFSNLPYDSDARGEKIMIKDVNGGKVLATCDKNGKVKLDANNNPMQSRVLSGEEADMLEQYFNQGGIGDNTVTRSEWIYGIGSMSIANNPQPPVVRSAEQEVASLVAERFAGMPLTSSDTVRIMKVQGNTFLATCDRNGRIKKDAAGKPMQSRMLSASEAQVLEKYYNSAGRGDNRITRAEWDSGTKAMSNPAGSPARPPFIHRALGFLQNNHR